MARSPKKTPAQAANENERAQRRGGNAVTDFLDASEPLERKGFGEAPQSEFEGAPLSGPVGDWAKQISEEAEREGKQQGKPSKKIPVRSSAPTKTARGTSMGGAASPRDRAAAGRPADGHRRTGAPARSQRARPGAARRHRLGQDLHHGQGDRGTQRPALILAPNKTLAAQLYGEFKSFFPTTRSSISSPITTTTSPRPTSRAPTPISRRNPRSTSRSTACATRRRARCSSATT
jgi:hypothetical protein